MKYNFLLIIAVMFFMTSCSSKINAPIGKNFNGEHFLNLDGPSGKSFVDVIKWKMKSTPEVWPMINPSDLKDYIPPTRVSSGVQISYLNHSSFLIQTQGINIITDPIWSDRASPLSFMGPKMSYFPAIKKENLPPIDYVLVSHNHYDHMDKNSLSYLDQKFSPTFIVPLNNAHILKSFGIKKIKELNWWEKADTNSPVEIFLTPARHWSRRSLFDTNKSLWGSFVIKTPNEKIYFAGDTGYGIHFKEIFNHFGPMSVSLLPIGAYEPRWFMKEAHMNPEDAVLAHMDLASKKSIGMHFGSVQLTDEGIQKPIEDLEIAKIKYHQNNFETLKSGEFILLP